MVFVEGEGFVGKLGGAGDVSGAKSPARNVYATLGLVCVHQSHVWGRGGVGEEW